MLALVLALAATVVEAPCGLVEKALERDRRDPSDAVLREAAAEAENAGDILLATKLLARLRDRTKDAAVASEAAFMLETLDPRSSEFTCRGLTRDVLVYFDPASLLSEEEREVMTDLVGDDLDDGALLAFLALPLVELEATFDEDRAALGEVLLEHLCGTAPRFAIDVGDLFALLIVLGAVATVDGQAELGHGLVAGDMLELGVTGEVAEQDDLVE